ncbi:MAG: DUF3616 domain-containing protein, partial [Myxococcaceae bacterium]
FALNLGGRGIRGLAWSEARQAMWVLAGPRANGGTFQLYTWSGVENAPPALVRAVEEPATGNPEALVAYAGSKDLQILNDSGGNTVGGTTCKSVGVDQKYFTDQTLRLD